MKRIFATILITLLFLTLSLIPSEGAGAQLRHSPNRTGADLIDAVNILRVSKGLPPYQVNLVLMTIAQAHAEYIAGQGVLTHFSADGRRPYQRALDAGYLVAGDLTIGGLFAENVHSGTNLDNADVVQVWQGHSTNSETLLSKDFMDAGAGVATINGVTYYVFDAGAADFSTTPIFTPTPAATSVTGTGVAVSVNTALPNGEIFHTVKKNEALWNIALAYETTIETLKSLNGLAADEIFEGQTLLIKQASTATVSPTVVVTATFGIPTSTATIPITPTITSTATPVPTPPASMRTGGAVVAGIILLALIAAGIGSLLGRKRTDEPLD